ncbi:DUF3016 domain-containing protein [Diaphorobacter sp. HDW4A]|uniref:DUF3016 domain-containing protein n=1 Tax=Diaphorobacter sp. HDW4A TaxID=2714924 RepID=UPI00140861B7|nr:DUF3016 domain-containing protein [Diaphorobacter sp. HDW4A]QIL82134.1 DUF3016 domain-containing protein [Diaphorobacter sp. HDW4A]
MGFTSADANAEADSRHGASAWGRLGTAFVMSALLLVLSTGCSLMQKDPAQPREVQAGTVSVTTANPDSFTPVPSAQRESKAARRAWVEALSEHLADRVAEALPNGERAEVHVSDIRRATAMTGASQEVVPPRIVLTFKRLSPKGKVVQSASRTLQDTSLQLKGRRYENDPLRYEKALVDDWVTREFTVAGK